MDEVLPDVLTQLSGRIGFITLNRPKALNALSLSMIRALTETLATWRADPQVLAVAIRGTGKEGPFGSFCAGGDIRFFHQAALAGDPQLDAFFTEEYRLNHMIFTYPKPYLAFMDGVVMGGGMGISQGGSVRVVSERTKMAMPETQIGLFPDVGGGYFLSRCPGRVGEYLALTGQVIGGREAVTWGLADGYIESSRLPVIWKSLVDTPFESGGAIEHWVGTAFMKDHAHPGMARDAQTRIDKFFGLPTVGAILVALEADATEWCQQTAAALRKRSPLMLHVVLEQVRRARKLGLADELRLERTLVHHCFHHRPGASSETVEGIRALAVDKDHQPQWNPARVEDVTPEMVSPFFADAWPGQANPLSDLG